MIADNKANIPQHMLGARRWLVFKLIQKPGKGKPDKVPFYANGKPRSGALDTADDLGKLVSFDEAVIAAKRVDGIGFALGNDGTGNYWQGIDFDDVGKWHALQGFIKEGLPGYFEKSISGNGWHCIGYGKPFKALGASPKIGIEAYSSGRFFTFSGDCQGGDLECLQNYVEDILAPVYRRYVYGDAKINGTDFKKHAIGKQTIKDLRSALNSIALDSDGYDLWHRIGHALKTIDPESVGMGLWLDWSQYSERFNTSEALEKWKSFTPERTDYRVVFAEAQRHGWVNPGYHENENTVEFIDGESLALEAKAPVYLINNILESDSHGTLLGASQSFKSFMALSIAFSVCTGVDFFGNTSFRPGKVIYVCGEGFGALGRRIKAISKSTGEPLNNLIIIKTPIIIDDKALMDNLKVLINELNPALVIFDTFSSLVSETNEDKNSEVAKVMNIVRNTCRNGFASSIIVHHYGKDEAKGARGAYAFKANSDFEFVMTRVPDSMNAVMSCKKMKDGEFFGDIGVVAEVVDLDMIRQDGGNTTSLILSPLDYVPTARKKKLTPRLSGALQALYDAINQYGVEPTLEIKNKYAGFSGTVIKKKIVKYETWRKFAYKTIEIERDMDVCPDSDFLTNHDSRKKAFQRIRDDLKKLEKIITYDGYVWVFD